MRPGYSSVGGGEVFSSYSLTVADLEAIVAEHFGYDPETFSLRGLEVPDGEIHVSGHIRRPDDGRSPR